MSPQPARRPLRRWLLVALDFTMPVALYYVLRALGAGVYVALLAGALASLVSAGVSLVRDRRMNGVALFMTTLLVLSTAVSLVGGGPRFLLARDAWVTGVAGVWFLASCWAPRPLAYHFARAVGEGRFGWPPDWESLWASTPRFRRMWRVSSVMWGVGTLLDAALRWVLAYTQPIDTVPALTLALYAVTTIVLFVVTNVYYVLSGAVGPHASMYAASGPAAGGQEGRPAPSPDAAQMVSRAPAGPPLVEQRGTSGQPRPNPVVEQRGTSGQPRPLG